MMYARGIPHHTYTGSEAGACLGKRAHPLLLKLGYVGVDASGSTRDQPGERVVSTAQSARNSSNGNPLTA